VGEKAVRSFVCHRVTECFLAPVALFGLCGPVLALALSASSSPAGAKSPGETHCYNKICHRVRTIPETRLRIGKATKVTATHYDHPSLDRYNTGKYTSSGEVFNADDPTRASSSNLPDGTELLVWNPENGRAVHVRVNDFGPFHSNRELDLTRAAAEQLGFSQFGVAELEVIIVAPPPLAEPRYRRGRRYPAALGYLGVLGRSQVESLAKRLVRNRRLNRMASIDIQQFLWSTKARELGGGQSVVSYSPPLADTIREHREAISILPYAKASADPHLPRPPFLAALADAPHPVAPVAFLRTASFADAEPLNASFRPAARLDEGPARFGLRLEIAEKAGWRVPPSLEVSQAGRDVRQPEPMRVAALWRAPIRHHAASAYEIATADVDSIRWSIPGLDAFMRVMTPVWGTGVSPLQALEAVAAMAVAVIMSALAILQRVIAVQRSQLRRRAPFAAASLPSRVRRHLRARPQPESAADVTPFELERLVTWSQMPFIRMMPHASVIARGLRVDGTLESSGRVIVSGEVFGDCRCHSLVIEPGGRLEGNVVAVRVEIRGRYKGAIDAAALIIDDRAMIDGDIDFKTIRHASVARPAGAGYRQRLYGIAAE